ncbi:endolytic transglycosylase MltG [Crossiella sp. SN42]|uniref:endolytic transglycosylase MltG n=1 Tax=Crossiella sp. SN42 TaxID=2944808 RepID=UPI00207C3089|nr:endolytic transglycosylase MltG [Crossiella sp. SN42]MCO1578626.1 endolytic transglycosylase MltG [Crossiella sp. SN42]
MSSDDLGLFDEGQHSSEERSARDKKAKRTKLLIGAGVAAVVIGVGVWMGALELIGIGSYDDYEGSGESDVVVQIEAGTISKTGKTLADAGVVASARAYTEAAESNTKLGGVQPGYYLLKAKMSGAAAGARLLEKEARVGDFEVKGGYQLYDTKLPGDKINPGILSRIAEASCAKVNGKDTCVSAEAIREVMEKADPASLGVPDWAIGGVTKADPKHRLEGLIMPGRYDVKPGATPEELLKAVLSTSATRLQAVGLPKIARDTGFSDYDVLIIASLIEREGITKDFAKVSRVLYNRLAKDMKLELDSTINYALDRPLVRTTKEDRERAGAYNTYANTNLPPTPIASAGNEAILAATKPEAGNWIFFVKCYKDGTSCFAETNAQHNQNRSEALARGAY